MKDCKDCKHFLQISGATYCGKTKRPSLSVITKGDMFNYASWEREEGSCGLDAKNFESNVNPKLVEDLSNLILKQSQQL